MLDNCEVRPGKFIGVCVSLDNCRLFIGCIPKDKKKEEIMEEMKKVTDGVVDVIVYPGTVDKSRNRGFAFVEYESHKAAAMARRTLIPGTFQLWGHSIQVDWAEPEKDVDEEVMQRVRVLYRRSAGGGRCFLMKALKYSERSSREEPHRSCSAAKDQLLWRLLLWKAEIRSEGNTGELRPHSSDLQLCSFAQAGVWRGKSVLPGPRVHSAEDDFLPFTA
ncbi:hypothetical protein AMECASPLE_030682 [Ameca splendens]|uniref:RRM domain-containing protein n=1 Tax=Ameca splendens TaxID=208324 RepID=A0ABV0ZRM9_9TELE